MKLSVVYIVKNEGKILKSSLETVKDADEIIIYDTGSTDNTLEIAKEYTDKIYTEYKWKDDFADARNRACSKASGNWILSMDADWKLVTKIQEVKKLLKDKGAYRVTLISGNHRHRLPVLFSKGHKYYGRVHELIESDNFLESNVVITYTSSTSRDSKRNLRILKKSPKTPRNLFYLANEYMTHRDYKKAIKIFLRYLKIATWFPEISEAYLCLAKCYFQTNQGNKAREVCIQAIRCNPEFKEAYLYMAELHYEPYKTKWLELSKLANNVNVLFVRT